MTSAFNDLKETSGSDLRSAYEWIFQREESEVLVSSLGYDIEVMREKAVKVIEERCKVYLDCDPKFRKFLWLDQKDQIERLKRLSNRRLQKIKELHLDISRLQKESIVAGANAKEA